MKDINEEIESLESMIRVIRKTRSTLNEMRLIMRENNENRLASNTILLFELLKEEQEKLREKFNTQRYNSIVIARLDAIQCILDYIDQEYITPEYNLDITEEDSSSRSDDRDNDDNQNIQIPTSTYRRGCFI